jgi:hypothetical protein
MDANAVEWYQQLLKKHARERTVVVASNNDKRETFLCSEELDINLRKP